MEAKVEDIFKVEKRTCIIIKMDLGSPSLKPYHNGYVSVLGKNKGKFYNKFIGKIKTDELTFSDNWDDKRISENRIEGAKELKKKTKGMWFFGFDSAHYWNGLHPESKTFKSVRERTIELAKEMIRKGV